jgi:hypothetical protein
VRRVRAAVVGIVRVAELLMNFYILFVVLVVVIILYFWIKRK